MKTAFEYKNVQSVKAWGLFHGKQSAGRIVARVSNDTNGTGLLVCTMTMTVWAGKIYEWTSNNVTVRTKGWEWRVLSDAFDAVISEILPEDHPKPYLRGSTHFAIKSYLESLDYSVIEVL